MCRSATPITATTFTDATAASQTVYSYAVRALDTTGNPSALSTPVTTAPGTPTTGRDQW